MNNVCTQGGRGQSKVDAGGGGQFRGKKQTSSNNVLYVSCVLKNST